MLHQITYLIMIYKSKQNVKPNIYSALLLATSIIIFALNTEVQAQPSSNEPSNTNKKVKVTFNPPKDLQPKNSAGGASRSTNCSSESSQFSSCLTPLIPPTNQGLTTLSHPTFLVHIANNSGHKGFLSIKDENNNDIYQTELPLEQQSTIARINLPADAPALEVGKTYKWSFATIDGNFLKPDTPFVEGYVKRVELQSSLQKQLTQATPLEKVALYGKEGIWYETVADLAELNLTESSDPNMGDRWKTLLNSVGLEEIASQTLLK